MSNPQAISPVPGGRVTYRLRSLLRLVRPFRRHTAQPHILVLAWLYCVHIQAPDSWVNVGFIVNISLYIGGYRALLHGLGRWPGSVSTARLCKPSRPYGGHILYSLFSRGFPSAVAFPLSQTEASVLPGAFHGDDLISTLAAHTYTRSTTSWSAE